MEQLEYGDERLPSRFWEKLRVNEATQCWEWIASKDTRGYGRIWVLEDRKQRPAHVVAYKALVGPIESGLQLDHLCRVRHCVYPLHVEPVTGQENVRRGDAGKRHSEKTHCPQEHPYSEDNTYVDGKGGRHCRICQYEANKRKRLSETAEQRDHRLKTMTTYRRNRKLAA